MSAPGPLPRHVFVCQKPVEGKVAQPQFAEPGLTSLRPAGENTEAVPPALSDTTSWGNKSAIHCYSKLFKTTHMLFKTIQNYSNAVLNCSKLFKRCSNQLNFSENFCPVTIFSFIFNMFSAHSFIFFETNPASRLVKEDRHQPHKIMCLSAPGTSYGGIQQPAP